MLRIQSVLLTSFLLLSSAAFSASNTDVYRVVINHEEQYSILPVDREVPPGWKTTGVSGSKEACLEHIEEVWTDMRPLNRRNAAIEIYKSMLE